MSHTKDGWKSIHVIAGEGNLKLLDELIEKKCDLKLLTRDGRTMLHIAALNRHFPFVKRLLTVCPDIIKVQDVNEWTALHFSVASGDIQIFQEIANKGLSPRDKDKNGATCLHIAARSGFLDMVKKILDVCPDSLHAVTNEGRTAIHEAVEGGHCHVLKELAERSLSVKAQDKKGSTCLHLAAVNGHITLVKQLMKDFPELKNIKRFDGTTALHEAASRGFLDVFDELLRSGLSITSFSDTTGNCLHAASYNGQLEMVRFILQKCPELLNSKTAIDKWTPLHIAAAGGHLDVFNELLNQKADLRCETAYKGTIFHIAVAHGKCKMVEYLMTVCKDIAESPRMDGWTPLHQCASDGQIDVFNVLMNGGVSINAKGKNGETCLHVAASRGQYQMVRHIIKTCPLILHARKTDGRTALHEAAGSGNIDTFEELSQSGISKDVKSLKRETCLHIAALEGRYEIVSHITRTFSDLLDHTNTDGWNALHSAASKGHVETCKILVSAGLSLKTKTQSGKTVEDIARLYGQNNVVEYIFQKEEDLTSSHRIMQRQSFIDDKLDLYLKTVKGEEEKRRNIRIMVVGFERVGKTSFCWRLMNKDLQNGIPSSTDGIDIYINRFLIDLDKMERIVLENETAAETSIYRLRDVVRRVFFQKSETTESKDQDYVCVENNPSEENTDMPSTSRHETSSDIETSKRTDEKEQSATLENLRRDNAETGINKNELSAESKYTFRRVMSTIPTDDPGCVPRNAYASLWDFGGHTEYYNSHHIFLSSDAVYVLVFKISQCLEDKQEREKIKFWLQSIETHTFNTKVSSATPPILPIGTHLDEISTNEEKQQEAHEKIEQFIHGDPEIRELVKHHLVGFYSIDTINETEETFNDIWNDIMEAAKKQSQWERKLPVRWLILENELMKRRANGVKIMSVRDVLVLSQKVEVITNDEEDIREFLRYLQFTGEVLKFSGTENVHDKVVIDPQWIVHAFRCFMAPPQFRKCQSGRHKILWDAYKRSALLDPDLINKCWSKEPKNRFLDHRETLLNIMERLGLIVSPPSERLQSTESTLYYVPAMFKKTNPKWLEPVVKTKESTLSCSLCFVFSRAVPFTILDKVLAFCIQKYEPFDVPDHDCSKCLQRGFSCFKIGDGQNMILSYSESLMKATLLTYGPAGEIAKGAGEQVRKVLENILMSVFEINQQQHVEYEHYLHNDYRITAGERRVTALEVSKSSEGLYSWGDEVPKKLITKSDYNVWFRGQDSSYTLKPGEICRFQLPPETLKRQMTEQEMARISRYIGGSYLALFCELGLTKATIENILISNKSEDFRSNVIRMLNVWTNTKGEEATIRNLLEAMFTHDFPYSEVIKCLKTDNAAPINDGKENSCKRSREASEEEEQTKKAKN